MKTVRRFLLLPFLLLLVACGGTSAKDTFIERLKENQSAKQAAYDITFTLEEADLGESGYNPLAGFVGQNITFSIGQDMDASLVHFKADLSMFSPEWSNVEMIYADDKAYMTAAPMLAMSGLPAADYQGKYIDLAASSGQTLPALSQFSPADYQNVELYQDLDAKHFSKKGDEAILTLTVPKLLELVQKNLEATDETAAATFKEQAKAALDQFSADSKAEIAIDKKGNGRALVSLIAKGENKGKLAFKMTMKKVAYKAPTVPTEKDILSEEEMGQLMTGSAAPIGTLSDEDFEAFYTSMESSVSSYTKEEFQMMIDSLKPSLTEDQVKRLESLLPKTKAN